MSPPSIASALPSFEVEALGQIFTPPAIVDCMRTLVRNSGRVLEPACGDGAFLRHFPGALGIEIDPRHAPPGAEVMNFFELAADERFATIIGNPPYVRYQDISPGTRRLAGDSVLDKRANLYLFFIEKCLRHLEPGGELIFITPRDLTKATSAVPLNRQLFAAGTITDFIDLGDVHLFGDATPNCAIWRFERDNFSRQTRYAALSSGDGADGQTRRMIWCEPGEPAPATLLPHKERLLARRIRRYDESNWWQWGRGYHQSPLPRVYVNNKTRRAQPFFVHDCQNYDGAVMAIFPHDPATDVQQLAAALNGVDWADLGFVCDGRFLFTQRSLEQTPLPQAFQTFLPQAGVTWWDKLKKLF